MYHSLEPCGMLFLWDRPSIWSVSCTGQFVVFKHH